HEYHSKAIGIREGEPMCRPIRVGRWKRSRTQPPSDRSQLADIANVEDEQRLRMRHGRTVSAAARELEVHAGAGYLEKDAVVAVVVVEAADLAKADPIAIEGEGIVETIRVPRDAELDRSDRCSMRMPHSVS